MLRRPPAVRCSAAVAAAFLLSPLLLSPLLNLPLSPPVQAQTLVRPILKLGSQGAAVSELQATLKLLGFYSGPVDGSYGGGTAAAVSQFQQAAGLGADGVVGADTWNRLLPSAGSVAAAPAAMPPVRQPISPQPTSPQPISSPPSDPSDPYPILRRGAQGDAVARLQERLQAQGFLTSGVDGDFGEATLAAVMAAQSRWGLDPDGVVGPATWQALSK